MLFDPENLANPDYLDECSFRELEASAYLPHEEGSNLKSSFSDVIGSLDSQRDIWTAVVAARNAMKFLLHRSQVFYDPNDSTRYDRRQKKEEDGSPMIPEDKEAQEIIVSTIKKRFPEDSFLAEEGVDEEGKNPTRRWIIDGLDGTGDFIHSSRHFCSAIALAKGESLELAVIINRMGDIFFASRGEGAHFGGASNPQSQRIQVSTEQRIQHLRSIMHEWVLRDIKKCNSTSEIARHFQNLQFDQEGPELPERKLLRRTEWGRKEEEEIYSLRTQTRGKIFRTMGSSSLEQARLANGFFNCFIKGPLHPWDALAGTLLIKEAGGKVTNWKGENRKIFERGPILASNGGPIHEQLVELMGPIAPPWE